MRRRAQLRARRAVALASASGLVAAAFPGVVGVARVLGLLAATLSAGVRRVGGRIGARLSTGLRGAAAAWALWLAALTIAAAAPGVAVARPVSLQAMPKPGQAILQIQLDAAPNEDKDALLALSGLSQGRPYDPAQVRRAVKLLYQLGRFANVRVYTQARPGGLALRIALPPRPVIREITVIKSAELSEEEIRRLLEWSEGVPLDLSQLPADHHRLTQELRRRGFGGAVVGILPKTVDDSGGRELLVRVEEGEPTRLRRLVFGGQLVFPPARLAAQLSLSAGDVVSEKSLQDSLRDLQAYYRQQGYLDVRVESPEVRMLDPQGAQAEVRFQVQAGPKVQVFVRGNRRLPRRMIDQDLASLRSFGTGPAALAEARDHVLSRYQQLGYWRAKVAVDVRVTPDRRRKQVLLSIREGTPARIASLRFPGNQDLPEAALREAVYGVVASMTAELRATPGIDPQRLADAIGDRSLRRPRDSPQPVSSPPDPTRVYYARAYRAAREAIADLYRARGYHSVVVGPARVRPRPGGALVDVELPIQQGIQWRLAVISFAGNDALSSRMLWRLVGLDGDHFYARPLNYTEVERARRAILDEYKRRGYLYARVHESLGPPRSPGSLPEARSSEEAAAAARDRCAALQSKAVQTCPLSLRFQIEEGPLVTTRQVVIRGLDHTRPGIVAGEITVRPGTTLRERELEQTRDHLSRLGVFERVEVGPIDPDAVAAEKDVVVSVKERKRYTTELSAGASTEAGLRVAGGFGDNNLLGTALHLQTLGKLNVWLPQLLVLYDEKIRPAIETFYNSFGTVGRLEYEVAVGLSSSRVFSLPSGFSAGLDVIALRDYDLAFAERSQLVSFVVSYKGLRPILAGRPRQLSFQLRTNYERTELQCNPLITDRPQLCSTSFTSETTVSRIAGSNQYISTGPSVSWDLRNDPLDPSAGAYFELSNSFAWGLDTFSPDFIRVGGKSSVYLPLSDISGLAFSAQLEKLFPVHGARARDIPLNKRLFLGGRSTVRGFAEGTMLPQDTPLDPRTGAPTSLLSTGGLLRVALKSELRVRLIGPLSLALFFDVGDLYESGFIRLRTRTRLEDGRLMSRYLAAGGGVGLRVATPIGPLAIDMGIPLYDRDGQQRTTQFHFAVGTF